MRVVSERGGTHIQRVPHRHEEGSRRQGARRLLGALLQRCVCVRACVCGSRSAAMVRACVRACVYACGSRWLLGPLLQTCVRACVRARVCHTVLCDLCCEGVCVCACVCLLETQRNWVVCLAVDNCFLLPRGRPGSFDLGLTFTFGDTHICGPTSLKHFCFPCRETESHLKGGVRRQPSHQSRGRRVHCRSDSRQSRSGVGCFRRRRRSHGRTLIGCERRVLIGLCFFT